MKLNDVDPAQVKEVFARFGLAMYDAQCLERQTAILVAACCNPEFLRKTPEERDAILKAEMTKTLGALVRRLSEQVTIAPSLEHRIATALKTRNWLAHNYFWERAGQLLTPSGREVMLKELTDVSNEMSGLDELLTEYATRWRKRAGVPDEVIEAELEKLRAEGSA